MGVEGDISVCMFVRDVAQAHRHIRSVMWRQRRKQYLDGIQRYDSLVRGSSLQQEIEHKIIAQKRDRVLLYTCALLLFVVLVTAAQVLTRLTFIEPIIAYDENDIMAESSFTEPIFVSRQFTGTNYALVEYSFVVDDDGDGKTSIGTESNTFPAVTVMMVIHNENSFGSFNQKHRDFEDVLELIASFNYPKHRLSFSILVADLDLWSRIQTRIVDVNSPLQPFYTSITLIYTSITIESIAEAREKVETKQAMRRRYLAVLRNMLLSLALQNNDGVLWVDPDVMRFPKDALSIMANSGKDIIAAATVRYKESDDNQQRRITNEYEEGAYGMMPNGEVERIQQEINESENDFVEYTSVESSVMYVRADLHREGVTFPPIKVIGADWEREEGYAGLESSGLCFIATAMKYHCWAMPNVVALST